MIKIPRPAQKIVWLLILLINSILYAAGNARPKTLLDSFSFKSNYDLPALVSKADHIVVVIKANPFITIQKTYIDSAKKLPPFEIAQFHVTILEVLKQDSTPLLEKNIPVSDAFSNLAYTVHCLYYQKKMALENIIGIYKPQKSLDSLDTMLIFLRRHKNKNIAHGKESYSLFVNNAFESASRKNEVISILGKINAPPDPWRWIKMRRKQRNDNR
jgi:hypothetical protein